jgi:hypothetical protein
VPEHAREAPDPRGPTNLSPINVREEKGCGVIEFDEGFHVIEDFGILALLPDFFDTPIKGSVWAFKEDEGKTM